MSDTVPVRVDDGEEIFASRLHERFIADGIVRFAAKTSRTAGLGRRDSMGCHLVHDSLPSSLRYSRIMCGEICAREIEIEPWFTVRFVHRMKQAFGFASFRCAERSLLLRAVFLPIKNAVMPAVHSIFDLHVFLHVEENERSEFFPLASGGGVAAQLVRIVRSRLVLLAFLLFPVLASWGHCSTQAV